MTVLKTVAAAALVLGAQAVQAQTVPTTGTLVIVPANGEVRAPNDQAVTHFAIEEQDKDKAAAASRVNQKMKQGMEILKREDPNGKLKTQGYYSYAVYAEDRPQPVGTAPKKPVPVAWRVGQSVELTTTSLDKLPKTVAAAQKVLTLNSINFGLTPEATRKLDDQRIAVTYKALNERIASIASAMGRKTSDAVLETVDFEGSGNYAREALAAPAPMMMMRGKMADSADVAEPSFEPGETMLDMRLVGKVRFK
ncbi:SIMPL domain-containing protein [Massilia sp. SM-13]|uniref:SIMPL domain-containing protein n=1 Tax=Pseudoduganella rhizocola TaxID=3382643 RepID=UPI0038B5DE82